MLNVVVELPLKQHWHEKISHNTNTNNQKRKSAHKKNGTVSFSSKKNRKTDNEKITGHKNAQRYRTKNIQEKRRVLKNDFLF